MFSNSPFIDIHPVSSLQMFRCIDWMQRQRWWRGGGEKEVERQEEGIEDDAVNSGGKEALCQTKELQWSKRDIWRWILQAWEEEEECWEWSGVWVTQTVTGTKRTHGRAKQTEPLQCPERPSATAPLDRWRKPHCEPVLTPSSAKAAATSKHSFSLTSQSPWGWWTSLRQYFHYFLLKVLECIFNEIFKSTNIVRALIHFGTSRFLETIFHSWIILEM